MGAMGALAAVGAFSSITNGITQSGAYKAQGDIQKSVADTNAKIADLQGQQVLEAGDITASRRDLATRSAIGTARAAASGSGTDVNSGSNALLRTGITNAGAMDELVIRNNAARQAWGYKVQGMNDTFQGKMAKMTADNMASQSLLTGGLEAIERPLSMYANYKMWSKKFGFRDTGTDVPFDLKTGK